jgi:hypothetical protein
MSTSTTCPVCLADVRYPSGHCSRPHGRAPAAAAPVFLGHPHTESRFPHEGGCLGCAKERRCNCCGALFGIFGPGGPHCTNGRCRKCHDVHCTPGGGMSPGHGYWRSPPAADGGAR